jgi:hypothetical protein
LICNHRKYSAKSFFIAILGVVLCACVPTGQSLLPVTFEPPPGEYIGPVEIVMTPAPEYSEIYFTIDGTEPDTSAFRYEGYISIASTTTLKAIAVDFEDNLSVAVSGQYSISGAPASEAGKPLFSPAPGAYSEPVQVTLRSATPGALIYYTVNTSSPTVSSTPYEHPITIDTTTTIKTIAVAQDLEVSDLAVGLFIIEDTDSINTGTALLHTYIAPSYEINDYDLVLDSASLVVDSLNSGDRVVLIPIYNSETPFVTETGAPGTQLEVEIMYSGDPAPTDVKVTALASQTTSTADSNQSITELPDRIEVPNNAELPLSYLRRSGTFQLKDTASPYEVGDIVPFWLENDYSQKDYQAVSTIVKYKGAYCYIVMTDPTASHSGADTYASALGSAFDVDVYERITSLYGHEWGGDPAVPEDLGGIDGDTRIFILLNSFTANPPGGVFRSVNEYLDEDAQIWWGRRSNEKEMFEIFIDTSSIDDNINRISTAAHEFQHLVEYNQRLRLHAHAYETSFINEGLSIVAEDLTGSGPDLYRLREAQTDPILSYIYWDKTPHYSIGQGYSAAYVIMSYMVRRFGTPIIADLMLSSVTGLESFEAVLSANDYHLGYQSLVLDAWSAHYVNDVDGIYSYPPGAPPLYDNDQGIDLRSGNTIHGDTRYVTYQLHGPAVHSYTIFPEAPSPVAFDVELFEYGIDFYEFLSGDNGVFQIAFNKLSPDIAIRILTVSAPVPEQPLIDGRGWDWLDTSLVHSDTQGDASVDDAADIIDVYGNMDTDYLYLLVETASPAPAPDEIDSPALDYRIDLDLIGNSNIDYSIFLHDTDPSVYRKQPWERLDMDLTGIQYMASEAFEIRLPLASFGIDIKSTISAILRFSSVVDGVAEEDTTSAFLIMSQ